MNQFSFPYFQYAPLNQGEIRLATILPGAPNDGVHVQISHHALSAFRAKEPQSSDRPKAPEVQQNLPPEWEVFETSEGRLIFNHVSLGTTSWRHPVTRSTYKLPKNNTEAVTADCKGYEALSYVWGEVNEPGDKPVIYIPRSLIHGPPNHTTRILNVGRNLSIALRSLRSQTERRTFFVDAVCIDQHNESERNQQVRQMADVYKLASRVIIWLGQPSGNSSLAVSTIHRIAAEVQMISATHFLPSPGYHLAANIGEILDDGQFAAIKDILDRSYFHRLWILQEVRLANEQRSMVTCGSDEIPWENFRRALLYLWQHGKYHSIFMNSVKLLWPTYTVPMDFILSPLGSQCLDPRDRIYAHLGLMPPSISSRINPNYGGDVKDVFKNAVLASTSQTCRLDVLCSHITTHRNIDGPTWVPDWSSPGLFAIEAASAFTSGLSPVYYGYVAPNTLSIRGVKHGRIKTVMDCFHSEPSFRPSQIKKLYESLLLGDLLYADNEWCHRLATSLLLGGFKARVPSSNLDFNYLNDFFMSLLNGHWEDCKSSLEDSRISKTLQLLQDRQVVVSSEGHFGVATLGALPGDILCAILGHRSTVILRPTNHETYTFVGVAYVHDFVDGEAFLGPLAEPWRLNFVPDETGLSVPRFLNADTGELTEEDPRLPSLPPEWERLETRRTLESPLQFARFRNKISSEEINWDPRMSLEALQARGVEILEFDLE